MDVNVPRSRMHGQKLPPFPRRSCWSRRELLCIDLLPTQIAFRRTERACCRVDRSPANCVQRTPSTRCNLWAPGTAVNVRRIQGLHSSYAHGTGKQWAGPGRWPLEAPQLHVIDRHFKRSVDSSQKTNAHAPSRRDSRTVNVTTDRHTLLPCLTSSILLPRTSDHLLRS